MKSERTAKGLGKQEKTQGAQAQSAESGLAEETMKNTEQNEQSGAEKDAEHTAKENADEAGGEKPAEGEKSTGEDQEELQAKYVRLAADFQNFRRRTENEKKEIYAYANESIVKELLTVMDNFERAVEQAKDCGDQAFADGVILIYKQLKESLEKFGTQEILALGEEFNPNIHHAVMMDPSGSGESGKVTEVLQKGYTLNGRVVRPSMVKVAE